MKVTPLRMAVVAVIAFALLLVVFGMAGCGKVTPGQINPTYGVNGQCFEADGEPCDDDPFDVDDLFEHKKATPTPKPKPPVKKTPAPIRTTRRR